MNRVWLRRLFQLGLLLLAAPVYMLYRQLQPGAPSAGEQRLLLEQAIGQWHVTLLERSSGSASNGTGGAMFREYELQICDDCIRTLRAAFISTERPLSTDFGAIFSGGPTVFHSRLSFSNAVHSNSKIWLTLEGWNGNISQVRVP